MRDDLVTTEEALKQQRPGAMIYGRFWTELHGWETGFMFREDSRQIARLGKHPKIHLRATLMQQGAVFPIIILVKTPLGLSECYFNYHAPGDHDDYIHDWLKQAHLSFLFFTHRGRERHIIVKDNPMRELLREALPVLQAAAPWTMAEFDEAKAAITKRFTLKALWGAIAEQ
ncbi:MAG: hypothetical protein HY326_01770 [Chloroflexi bacterium]|nr:hypothetical protein [Chloroflexota bacterium]